jgi:polar amino acid transport system substrate-binding protein
MGGRIRAATLCTAIFLVFLAGNAFSETFTLTTGDTYPRSTTDGKGYCDLIIKEMFRRLGHAVKSAHMPAERALVIVDEGIDDGTYTRIAGLEKQYPNLVMVPEKVSDFEFAAFAKKPIQEFRDWRSLQPYNVGIVTGWKILETNIQGTRSLTKVRDDEALFSLLVHDRAEVVVFDRIQGLALIKRKGLVGIEPLEPLLATREMYLYVNKRHGHLMQKLAGALQEMKQDGTWEQITRSVLDALE